MVTMAVSCPSKLVETANLQIATDRRTADSGIVLPIPTAVPGTAR